MKITSREIERKHDLEHGIIGAVIGGVAGYLIMGTQMNTDVGPTWILPTLVGAIIGGGLGTWLGPLFLKG